MLKMLKRARQLPSPALAISVIALIVAVGGGSFAIAALTNSQVKRIAKKEAKKVAPRSAQAFANDNALLGPANDETILRTRIKVPKRGFLQVNAGGDVFGNTADQDTCYLRVSGSRIPSSNRTYELGPANTEEDCTTETTVRVGKGRHRVAFIASNLATGNRYDEASLQVEWVKFGNGGASTAKASKAAGGSGSNN